MNGKETFSQKAKALAGRVKEIKDRQKEKMGPERFRLIAIGVTTLVTMFFIMLVSGLLNGNDDNESVKHTDPSSVSQEAQENETETAKTQSEKKADSGSNDDEKEPGYTDDAGAGELAGLKQSLLDFAASMPGEWSFYVKNLKTGDRLIINDRTYYPASMIKLFCAGACYQKIEDGEINEDDYYDTIYTMVQNSNNISFNTMVWAIGKTYINEWCKENGYINTKQYHGLLPAENAEGLTTSDAPNQTCPSDVGKALEDIYNGEYVSKDASEKILKMLFEQHYRDKIPAGVPYGSEVANKTGEIEDYSHDAAIVYSPEADYILVIMSKVPGTGLDEFYQYALASQMVYNYINYGSAYIEQ